MWFIFLLLGVSGFRLRQCSLRTSIRVGTLVQQIPGCAADGTDATDGSSNPPGFDP